MDEKERPGHSDRGGNAILFPEQKVKLMCQDLHGFKHFVWKAFFSFNYVLTALLALAKF